MSGKGLNNGMGKQKYGKIVSVRAKTDGKYTPVDRSWKSKILPKVGMTQGQLFAYLNKTDRIPTHMLTYDQVHEDTHLPLVLIADSIQMPHEVLTPLFFDVEDGIVVGKKTLKRPERPVVVFMRDKGRFGTFLLKDMQHQLEGMMGQVVPYMEKAPTDMDASEAPFEFTPIEIYEYEVEE